MASTKTASVNVRIDQGVKVRAEEILSRIGIPRAVAIDMFYRQIILHSGIPFALNIPRLSHVNLVARDSMTRESFDNMMRTGLQQAKDDHAADVDEFFDRLAGRLHAVSDSD